MHEKIDEEKRRDPHIRDLEVIGSKTIVTNTEKMKRGSQPLFE